MSENTILSKHAKEQIEARGISAQVVERVIHSPLPVVEEDGKKIYQSIINFNECDYLVRVFVNVLVNPNIVITAYKTSKIDKYL